MKIAVGKNELNRLGNKASELLNFLKKENEVIVIDEKEITNDFIKKEWVNVVITSDNNIIRNIFSSISLNTSTYVISNSGTLLQYPYNHYLTDIDNVYDISNVLHIISINRKPSKEKIWNRYYTDQQLDVKFPEMTETDYLRSMKLDPNLCAYEYFGKRTTHAEHESELLKYAGRLLELGVKKGDFVSICMPNCPELVKLKYCLEDIGCTANFIDPRVDSKTLEHCLKTGDSKILFILDSKYKQVEEIIDSTKIDNVYLMTPFESLNGKKKMYCTLMRFKGNKVSNSGYKTFDDFLKVIPKQFEKVNYEKGHISSIQYTSGTTGAPKAVMIDGNSYNCRVSQYRFSNDEINLSKGERLLQALPLSGLAFGEYAMQLGMCKGMENVLVPTFNPKTLAKMIDKTGVNAFVMPPLALYEILNSKHAKKMDFSKLHTVAIGGEGITRAKTNEANGMLKKYGSPGHIIMGGGCTEGVVCNTTETHSFTEPGTAGFPLIGNSIVISDENGNELSYNERGTINYNPIAPMLGYYNNPELTNEVVTKNGIDLGDAGSIDEKGFLTYLGRKSQILYFDDMTIYPHDIEERAMELKSVDFCVVAGKKDIRLFFTVKKNHNIEDALFEIQNLIDSEYSNIKNLIQVIPLNSIPYTKNCKTDREKLSGDINNLDLYVDKKHVFTKKKFGLHK